MTKKILFFCGGSYVYGKEKSMLGIMIGMKERGFEVYNISNGWNDGKFNQMLKDAGINYYSIKLGIISKSLKVRHIIWTLHALLHLPFALYKIARIIRTINPDILFYDNIYTCYWSTLFAKINIPIIIRQADTPRNNFFLKNCLIRFKKNKIKFIGISKHICNKLINLGVQKSDIILIYNGFYMPVQHKADKELQRPLILGCAGQISPHKGQEVLIFALKSLKEKGINFKCYFAGSGESKYLNKLNGLIKHYNIEEDIVWLGYLKDMNDFYKKLDLSIVPSICEEAFGRVVIEAGLISIPSIVTNRGGLIELIDHGKNGYIVEYNNSKSLANAIIYFYNNPEKIKELGTNARNSFIRRFSIKKQIDLVSNLILLSTINNEQQK